MPDLSNYSDSDLQAIASQGALASISKGILGQESGNNPNIGSSIDGAIGQAQIMPGTFAQYAKPGEDINNPDDNLAVHQRILQDLSNRSGGDPARIAVGYFSGPGNIAGPDSPTPWKKDRTDGNGKSVSSYVSDVLGRVGNAVVPSAQAAEMPQTAAPDMSNMSNDQLQAIANSGQTDPSGMGAQPWSALSIPSQVLPPIDNTRQRKLALLDNADSSLNSGGLRGFLAHETAMGANFISEMPGITKAGSALAALLGSGKGDTFGQRYNNLQDAQSAMGQAGSDADPTASILAKTAGLTGGLGLLNEIGGIGAAALPEAISSPLASFATKYPKLAGMVSNGVIGGLYGADEGNNVSQHLSNAAINGAIGAASSPLLEYATSKLLAATAGKLASGSGSAAADDLALSPLETDLKKIDPNTPIKQYENVVNPEDVTKGPAYYEGQNNPAITPSVSPSDAPTIVINKPSAVANAAVPETSEEMGKLANASYKEAADSGGEISPQGTNKFVDQAEKVMPQTAAGKIVAGETDTTKLVARLQALRDKPLSLAEAQEIDEALSDQIDNNTTLGKVDKQGLKLQKIQGMLRDIMHNPETGDLSGSQEGFAALQQGQKYWSQMMKMRDLERIDANAKLTDNAAQAIRSGVRSLLKSPNRIKYYSPQEKAALSVASKTGIMGEALRGVGSRLTQYAAGGAGLASGGPVAGLAAGAAAHAVSGAARSAAQKLASSRLQGAIRTVAKNTTPKTRK